MGSIRNEDYRQLSAFYANPDKYIETKNWKAAGRGDYDRYEWKDNSKTLRKAITRFNEATGGEMDEGEKGDLFFGGGFSLDGAAGQSWAKGGNSFFRDFESYDHFEERYKEKRAKEKAEEKPEEEEVVEPAKPPEPYQPSTKFAEARSRAKAYQDQAASIGNVFAGDSTMNSTGYDGMQEAKKAEVEAQGTTNDTDYGFDVTEADPDGPERRQLVFS